MFQTTNMFWFVQHAMNQWHDTCVWTIMCCLKKRVDGCAEDVITQKDVFGVLSLMNWTENMFLAICHKRCNEKKRKKFLAKIVLTKTQEIWFWYKTVFPTKHNLCFGQRGYFSKKRFVIFGKNIFPKTHDIWFWTNTF